MITADSDDWRRAVASLSDADLTAIVKDAFFWGMPLVGTYELRYVYTQLTTHPD